MEIMKKIVEKMHTFTVFDYALYEITIFVLALLLVKYLPFLTSAPAWVYLVIIAIWATHLYEVISGNVTHKKPELTVAKKTPTKAKAKTKAKATPAKKTTKAKATKTKATKAKKK